MRMHNHNTFSIGRFISATLIVLLFMVGCSTDRLAQVNARVWDTTTSSGCFPEIHDPTLGIASLAGWDGRADCFVGEQDDLKANPQTLPIPNTKDHSFGLVFSGGGTDATVAALGQLRALDFELKWMQHAQYASAVSNGAWVTVPYTYLRKDVDEQKFLGKYVAPNALNDGTLSYGPEASFVQAATNAPTFGKLFFAWLKGGSGRSFAEVMGSVYLQPFVKDPNRFFTYDANTRDLILQDNEKGKEGQYYLLPSDFDVARSGRPYLIVGGTIQKPQSLAASCFTLSTTPPETDLYPIEMSPLYVGVPSRKEALGANAGTIGGGYVEAFGYNSDAPTQLSDSALPLVLGSAKARFTLADMIAVSSANPRPGFTGILNCVTGGLMAHLGLPELRHWGIGEGADPKAREYLHDNGGNIDEIGLLPLLARQVANILVFVNSSTPFGIQEDGITPTPLPTDFLSYFQEVKGRSRNVAFKPRAEEDTQSYVQQLYAAFVKQKQEGAPLVHCQAYEVAQNDLHNVSPYKPNICWVYLDRTTQWIDLIEASDLSDEAKAKIVKQQSPFETFPQFPGEENARLTIEQVNLLSNLTAWTVLDRAPYIAKHLNLPAPSNN